MDELLFYKIFYTTPLKLLIPQTTLKRGFYEMNNNSKMKHDKIEENSFQILICSFFLHSKW